MTAIPENTLLGKNVVLERNISIGENVTIGHNTVVLEGTQIGDNVTVGNNCVLGVKRAGNKRMRKDTDENAQLIIQSGTTIGQLASLYSGTKIGQNVFIGDHASIRENVSINDESVIGRGAMIELNSIIGKACTIQTLAYVTGDTVLEDHVFIGPCVSMSNDKYMGGQNVTLNGPYIKKKAKIGNNTSILPGVTIGQESIIGAGAVVTKHVDDAVTAVGVPAKKLHD